jgi:hypothetical protein
LSRRAIRLPLLIISLGLILAGIALLSLGSSTSGLAGGCFFWPFPVIIACGAGGAGASYTPIIIGGLAVGLFSFLFFLLVQRRIEKMPDE